MSCEVGKMDIAFEHSNSNCLALLFFFLTSKYTHKCVSVCLYVRKAYYLQIFVINEINS